jgi:hypothetical protein
MTKEMTPNEQRARDIIDQIRQQGGGVCKIAYEEALKDPRASAAMKSMASDVVVDTAQVRVPGFSAFHLTKEVAQRASDRIGSGEYLSAAGDYAAVVAVGLTSVIPFGGDATIELLRSTGVDLGRSPLQKAYNSVTGLNAFCDQLDAKSRKASGALSQIEKGADAIDAIQSAKLTADIVVTDGQAEALFTIITAAKKSYKQAETKDSLELGALPKPLPHYVKVQVADVKPRP